MATALTRRPLLLSSPSKSLLLSSTIARNNIARSAACCYSTTPVLRNTEIPSSVVVLEYKYVPNMIQRREPVHEAHLALAKEYVYQGDCIAGGPVTPHVTHGYDNMTYMDQPTGAFFWFKTKEAAEQFMLDDPYAQMDLVTSYAIYDWNVVVSK